MSGSVERRTVYLGGNSQGISLGFGSGFPSASPFLISPPSLALIKALQAQGLGDLTGTNTYGTGAVKLDLLPNQLGPVVAISIAPDSPIQACDIFIGGREQDRHRISPGCPYWGTVDQANFAMVAPIGGIIGFAEATAAGFRQTLIWDAGQNGTPAVGYTTLGTALRLNIYRGNARPVEHLYRAPYTAQMVWDNTLANGQSSIGDLPTLFVCVDGRQRFDVSVAVGPAEAGVPTVSVWGIDAVVTMGSSTTMTTQCLVTALALAAVPAAVTPPLGVTGAFSSYEKAYQGNPFQWLAVQIGGGRCSGGIRVNAWDV